MKLKTGQIPDASEVADRLAIYDVLVAHSRGVDRADADILKSAYWPDAQVAYGGYEGPAHAFCERLPEGIKRFARTQHTLNNVAVEIDGLEARVETYVTAYHFLEQEHADDTEMTYLGRYLDHMQRRGNVWKIRFRRVVMDWNQNAAASVVWEGPHFAGLARGARAPDDPLYAFLTG